MTTTDKKIDQLARMVAKGFASTGNQINEVKEDLANLRTELKGDIANLRTEIKGDMTNLRNEIDIMLDRHIGTFRKDYDELSARVKRIEEAIFK